VFPGNEGLVEKKVKGDLANFLLVDLSSGNLWHLGRLQCAVPATLVIDR
jgi:hypothetical protein